MKAAKPVGSSTPKAASKAATSGKPAAASAKGKATAKNSAKAATRRSAAPAGRVELGRREDGGEARGEALEAQGRDQLQAHGHVHRSDSRGATGQVPVGPPARGTPPALPTPIVTFTI